MLADGIPSLLLPHQLLEAGQTDATALGLVTLAALGLAALVQPFAGMLSDRVGRFGVIAIGVVVAATGLALLLAPDTLVAGALLALVGASVAQAGQQPLLPDRVPEHWRGRGAGLKGVFDVGGAFVAFVLLGALLGRGNAGLAVGLLAAVLVGSFVLAFILLACSSAERPVAPADPSTRVDGHFWWLVAARFLFLLGIYVLGRFLVLYVAAARGVDADAAAAEGGLILAVLTLVTVLVSLPAGWLADRVGRRPLLVAGGGLAAVGIALVPATSTTAGMIALGVLVAVGSATFGAASWAALTELAPHAESGRLLGLANWGTAGAAAAAGLAGILIDLPFGGFGIAFVVAGLLAAAGGGIGWRALGPSSRRMRSAVPAEVGA
jgi:MFS family permease